jgi:hypothetical protein
MNRTMGKNNKCNLFQIIHEIKNVSVDQVNLIKTVVTKSSKREKLQNIEKY